MLICVSGSVGVFSSMEEKRKLSAHFSLPKQDVWLSAWQNPFSMPVFTKEVQDVKAKKCLCISEIYRSRDLDKGINVTVQPVSL